MGNVFLVVFVTANLNISLWVLAFNVLPWCLMILVFL